RECDIHVKHKNLTMQNVLIGILILIVGHKKFQSLVQYYAIQRVCHVAFVFHNCEIRNNVNISSWKRTALSCFILDLSSCISESRHEQACLL
uniref:Uncharacterized protein n=1 Tax=Ficedula albicollis TaxID=59894 RepID=A0A803VAQ3_FICAL